MRDIQEGIRIYSIVTPVITYKGTTYQNLTVLLMELRRNIIALCVCVWSFLLFRTGDKNLSRFRHQIPTTGWWHLVSVLFSIHNKILWFVVNSQLEVEDKVAMWSEVEPVHIFIWSQTRRTVMIPNLSWQYIVIQIIVFLALNIEKHELKWYFRLPLRTQTQKLHKEVAYLIILYKKRKITDL